MFKKNKFKVIFASLFTLLPALVGAVLWDKLPEKMPTHWNINGQADQYGSKLYAVLFMPIFLFAIYWFSVIITSLDPKNKGQNEKAFNSILFLVPVLSLVVNGYTYSVALGYSIKISAVFCILFGVMFLLMGNYMPKVKHNFTIGIKIPWTLNDEQNWNATHRLAGKIWFVGGFLIIPCAFLPQTVAFVSMFVIIFIITLIPVIYSYVISKRK